ncbi:MULTISPECIES: hypothetical protein [Mammaliicoccus]|nr:hypothetical protein [Mammaliicoccus sciuri]
MESKHDTKYFQSLIGRAELTENILKSIQNKSSETMAKIILVLF